MSSAELKAFMKHFYDECSRGKARGMTELQNSCSPNIVWHSATGRDLIGLEELKRSFEQSYAVFPDTKYEVNDLIAEGDRCVARFTFSGTHRGEFAGIAPTNRRIGMWAIAVARFSEGRMAEVWERYDTLTSMREMGWGPPTVRSEDVQRQ